ncbi:GSCFA domain-containing protein [Simiduia sp. 21SJ11W-1]|uniref:GSCFA domain-containing protein n=1 Tax=Simiduia sp. 21SJ11W-1 TaxID=2909669 RepID=UPI00209F4E4A|nr:GSCFA domain-containing protein [Simiduia sp. 21SJ11W-1]UTA49543.1 GSCFA domain-containing protein [Simiduia sp. 21SJ11W-1]
MSSHPYKKFPDTSFWRRSVSGVPVSEVDPVGGSFKLKLDVSEKIATAGSCFAQHIARHLRKSGYNYFVAETGHPLLSESVKNANNYGLYSARYGNIYTARQLLQLFSRAFGKFTPLEGAWKDADGAYVDPFRPTTQPGGYASELELEFDRKQHLLLTRKMFEELDVFVFTLGLTECWRSKEDGAVFPLCPGVEGGEFCEGKYEFYNQSISDVVSDMTAFVESLFEINSKAKIILTVSPVPLMATAEPDEHVLSATSYSKSVLRVAANELAKSHEKIHYFPSYEIITGAFNRGEYFAEDLRSVREEGVSHVMKVFMNHASNSSIDSASLAQLNKPAERNTVENASSKLAQEIVQVECDESALDKP